MENEDNLFDELVNTYGDYNYANIAPSYPNYSDFESRRKIELPKTFKDVIMKLCPEIRDVVTSGYRETTSYNPMNFEPIKRYLVGIDMYFDDMNNVKTKQEYSNLMDTYFIMTFSDMDFISFHVRSFIFPPEKSNEEKFFELFTPNITNPIP